jgi:hypothetical protein
MMRVHERAWLRVLCSNASSVKGCIYYDVSALTNHWVSHCFAITTSTKYLVTDDLSILLLKDDLPKQYPLIGTGKGQTS